MAEEIFLQKQENTSSISTDRLSELPDELLVHILCFLPTRDAVRTQLLRRFGNLWTFLPTLKFKYESPNFMGNVLKYHKSPTIDSLEVKENEFIDYGITKKLEDWVGVALKKKPKMFRMHCCYHISYHLNLHDIFTCESIVTLKLTKMSLNLPRLVNMRSLTTLKLVRIQMVDEDLKLLELGCPCLRELSFTWTSGLKKFQFAAPNIERLQVCFLWMGREDRSFSIDCPKLKFLDMEQACLDNLELVDVSSVTHARINNPFYDMEIHHFELLYNKFKNVEAFHFKDHHGFGIFLGTKVSMKLQQCGNERPAFLERDLPVLALKSRYQKTCLLGMCRLLRNSRDLEELILYIDVDIVCNCNMLLQELSSPCWLRYLESVTIHDFGKHCKTLLQLIEFMLKNAAFFKEIGNHLQ